MFIRRMVRPALALMVAAGLMLPLQANADKLQDVLKRGYLIVGTTSTTPPFGFKDGKGELTGFDIDVSRLIAKALFGNPDKVKFELLSNEARWSALQNDQVDMVAQFATITPGRLTRVGFTPRYFDSGMTAVVRKDSTIQSLQDIDTADVTIATLTVPEQVDLMKREVPSAKVASFETVDQQFLALRSGRVQAFLVDLPIGMWYAANNPEIRVVPELFSGFQNYGIAYKMGELAWKQFLDGFVSELTSGYSYLDYKDLYQKYFKVNPPPQRPYQLSGPK
ncbi:transporter substrate-binding domain-containing protein [Allopusillimonas soli]|uniref:Transporter substrate-binding domain-containing protein n=1 Tax=Allopusillimonas soli TaxID=659016 RepID=A0A853FBD7_9BURK|nr:transporter substrate-binding domain-containing protein [Allopusillimonas soli]NYT37277.1 transporter substrate-binding domain-containing protein [Allopusillimonas soli]TEA74728.1 transporter substrate-binding domain-containing protein [Allopusillimonas soli]